MSTCSIPGCDKPILAKRLCSTHYRRQQRHGDPATKFTAGRTRTAGALAADIDLPAMGVAARARYAAALNRKLSGKSKPGDDAVLRNMGNRSGSGR